MEQSSIAARDAFAFLRRFAERRPVGERCELCSAALADEHDHLVDAAARRLMCACGACAILFDRGGKTKYLRVPRRVQPLTDFRLSDLQWQALGVPIGLAFFLHSTPAGQIVAVYPSPGGATEAAVPSDGWSDLLEENPSLRNLEPDVEALLANRLGSKREYFRVGIDECYKLIGLIRKHWHGFSGGSALWEHVDRYFARLRERGGKANA
jgi:hypothetical protein